MNEQYREIAELDRVIHEPARLILMSLLYGVDEADFLFLLRETELSKGNLSSHLSKLEGAGYIDVQKSFRGKIPMTICRLTSLGRKELERYRKALKASL